MIDQGLRIDAVILAAGNSLRFGSDKRLYKVDGVPMLQRAIASIIDAVHSVTVVMKQDDHDVLPVLLGDFFTDSRIRFLLLRDPGAGVGSNLARAVEDLPYGSDGVLVALADMPYVQPKTVRAVVDSFEAGKIIAPVFIDGSGAKHRGHPVLFSRRFFPELALLAGDTGALPVLQRHMEAVVFLPVADGGILRDIDVPAA